MTLHAIKTTRPDDDLDVRTRRIRSKILDGIEETLNELAQPRRLRAAIEREVRAQCAALLCRQAMCRRAKRCRRKPCAVPAARFSRAAKASGAARRRAESASGEAAE